MRAFDIAAVADVRRFPGSRRHPHFGHDALAQALEEEVVLYRHLPELGGRRRAQAESPNRGWTQSGFRGYADHLRTAEFARGLEQLEALARVQRVAVMCALPAKGSPAVTTAACGVVASLRARRSPRA